AIWMICWLTPSKRSARVPRLRLSPASRRTAGDSLRNVALRGLKKAADAAGLNPEGVSPLSLHDLRHSYGSHLALSGLDIVRVSRQLGHARPSITLDLYSHEFEQAQHGDSVSEKIATA